jgi:uncharacterized protein YdeI (YjbR/CyaY-like superfamily)
VSKFKFRKVFNCSSSFEETMKKMRINHKPSEETVHRMPADLRKALNSFPMARAEWEDITPLARSDWICWIESAKKDETRILRIEKACNMLASGKRRVCCFSGCDHR